MTDTACAEPGAVDDPFITAPGAGRRRLHPHQLIMPGAGKRLELKQNERYGADPAYAEYVRSVLVLLPWVPLYSLRPVCLTLGENPD